MITSALKTASGNTNGIMAAPCAFRNGAIRIWPSSVNIRKHAFQVFSSFALASHSYFFVLHHFPLSGLDPPIIAHGYRKQSVTMMPPALPQHGRRNWVGGIQSAAPIRARNDYLQCKVSTGHLAYQTVVARPSIYVNMSPPHCQYTGAQRLFVRQGFNQTPCASNSDCAPTCMS